MLSRLETALCLGREVFDAELQDVTVLEVEKTRPILPVPRTLRILALHGFGQSGECLRIAMKTGQLGQMVLDSINADLLDQYENVEWLCPDAPLQLVPDTRYEDGSLDNVDIFAWWRVLDFDMQHEHLYKSLTYLAGYLKEHDPVDGIVGFSQGAAVAMMLAAMCDDTPQRRAALLAQCAPFSIPPPQAPFKFAVACCGFQNALQHYSGFYTPRITTPSLNIVAEFDTMVSAEQSVTLARACTESTMIHFRGTHHVPTARATLREMAAFIASSCARKAFMSPPTATYTLPFECMEAKEFSTTHRFETTKKPS
ncbi:hypothetical protein M409DRAFT_16646 [Zasmidium cellare ATCC 36951]|uniref:Serine hydrolase domain-containing protein n=1 Tax=Zasmidium cellare ATCC 36951 TaxID=1080233 RepID=A0A6A6CZV9_ZASCE|nr:uncharacterized protein M409DRAFT_16646 [Zasmidium cellare ATCC 36951]KAF2172684.1 hypothetical protein M409DRAFT_16646 [Zasmidium cellare ATCC 36951]